MNDIITAPAPVRLSIEGSNQTFPVDRIFCIGRNYAEHAAEMGAAAEPIFFMKPGSAATQTEHLSYPPATTDLHHEVELVLALGEDVKTPVACGVGIDLTRRDLQAQMKDKRAPWEIAKAFDASAVIGLLRLGPPREDGQIRLSINGETRQSGQLGDMILKPDALIASLARYFDLRPGDLIFTGTPAGVGPLQVGDRVVGEIDGLPAVTFTIEETR